MITVGSTATAVLCLATLSNGYTSTANDDTSVLEFEPRTYNGTGNNVEFPLWGSAGIAQLHVLAGADYADTSFTPPGDDRPTARCDSDSV